MALIWGRKAELEGGLGNCTKQLNLGVVPDKR